MLRRETWLLMLGATLLLAAPPGAVRTADDLDDLQEKAIKAAVKHVAPCVVKIETSGGTEVVRAGPRRVIRRGTGPTTGLIVSADGYVISSSFNFANKPSTIRVAIPGLKERRVAKVVATDQTRMLTLLKISDLPTSTKLPVPRPTPHSEMKIGYTSIAVGRTLSAEVDSAPSVSVGIISALDRIWGKALQTDAKVSPTNYGGPLIDLYGRVYGVLVPLSPMAEGELAGFEWYDSGIGFAIPLTDINSVLERMKKGTEKEPVVLQRGFLGVTMRSNDMYGGEPIVGTVAPGSAAEKAGVKPGDRLLAVDGKPVNNYAQLLHRLGSRYDGDVISIKVERAKKEMTLEGVKLGSAVAAYGPAFLGVLPMRDDPDPGVEVRYVYPKSPAASAGIKPGDRIMKVGGLTAAGRRGPAMVAITGGREQLLQLFEPARPDTTVSLELKRKASGKTETVKVKLGELTDAVPDELPEKSTAKKALTKPGGKPPVAKKDDKKPETGRLKRTTPAADHTYWMYVPDEYDPNISYGVLIWLHPVGKNKERDIDAFLDTWEDLADKHNFIVLCPRSDNPRGWTPGESEFVQQALRTVTTTYTVDRRRIVAHGMGLGGEMSFYLGFQVRPWIRGVATVAAHLGSNPRERVSNQPLSFFLVVGGKDPLKNAVAETKAKLTKHKYPVSYREIGPMGHEYLDGRLGEPTLKELVRWFDGLDRL
jgi:S1-C subfamily serine protease